MNRRMVAGVSLRMFILAGFMLVLSGFPLAGCSEKRPVRIGVAVQLTGRQAELGVQERNAIQIAVEEINKSGGIEGRPVELIVRDDRGVPDGARAAVGELIAAGVVAIIGPATSGQATVSVPMANAARMVMISPTVSSPLFSGKDDFFFRVFPQLPEGARYLAQWAFQNRKVTRIAILHDTDNDAYAGTFLAAAAERFRSLGGIVTCEIGYSSRTEPDFAPMVLQVFSSGANGVLVIASDDDTALIVQRIRMTGRDIPIFIANWAMTETLILNGGKAVDGAEGEQAYYTNSPAQPLRDFRARYQARFGQAPDFSAVFAYETAGVLAEALKRTGGEAGGLKGALLAMGKFKGLVDRFSFDRYGDVERPHYISVIRGGRFEIIDTTEPKAQ